MIELRLTQETLDWLLHIVESHDYNLQELADLIRRGIVDPEKNTTPTSGNT